MAPPPSATTLPSWVTRLTGCCMISPQTLRLWALVLRWILTPSPSCLKTHDAHKGLDIYMCFSRQPISFYDSLVRGLAQCIKGDRATTVFVYSLRGSEECYCILQIPFYHYWPLFCSPYWPPAWYFKKNDMVLTSVWRSSFCCSVVWLRRAFKKRNLKGSVRKIFIRLRTPSVHCGAAERAHRMSVWPCLSCWKEWSVKTEHQLVFRRSWGGYETLVLLDRSPATTEEEYVADLSIVTGSPWMNCGFLVEGQRRTKVLFLRVVEG